MEVLYAIGALASALAAVLAWVAKIKWSKEFAAAKDATIAAKQGEIEARNAQIEALRDQIEGLRDLTPMKIREYFTSVKAQLEEYNESLQQELDAAKGELAAKDTRIAELDKLGEEQAEAIKDLCEQRGALSRKAQQIEAEIWGVSQRAVLHGILAPLQRMELAIHLADRGIEAGRQKEAFERLEAVRSQIPEVKRCVHTFLNTGVLDSNAAATAGPLDSEATTEAEEVIAEVAEEFRKAIQRGGKTLVAHVDGSPAVPMKRDDFELILANLIDNAAKYGSPGTKIEVYCSRRGGEVVVDVVSLGTSLAEGEHERVFDLGYRTRSAATLEYAAAGIGLYAARRAAERWGGRLFLEGSEPEPNVGDGHLWRSTFRFLIKSPGDNHDTDR